MKIEILYHNFEIKDLLKSYKFLYRSDIKIDENNPSDMKRLVKKIIKDKCTLPHHIGITLSITCPLFLYYELLRLTHFTFTVTRISDELTFEDSDDFNDTDQANMVSLVKKVKQVIKDMPVSKARFFIPAGCHITFVSSFNVYQLYNILSILSSKFITDKKMKEFRDLLMKTLQDNNSLFFNEQVLESYQYQSIEEKQ